jgi:hypothetical protein
VKHSASPRFWTAYGKLPSEVRSVADKNFVILKKAPKHPSLHLKQVGRFWSVRVGRKYRALGVQVPGGITWFWIGTHAEYDDLIASR